MSKRMPVVAIERWPGFQGHPPETIIWRGWRKRVAASGRWWLVRKRGLFRRYKWLPVHGMFIELEEEVPHE